MTTTDEQELRLRIFINHLPLSSEQEIALLEKVEAQKQRWQIEARIDELTHVRMGHYAGVTEIFREGKAVTASERLKHLKSQLPSSDKQEDDFTSKAEPINPNPDGYPGWYTKA